MKTQETTSTAKNDSKKSQAKKTAGKAATNATKPAKTPAAKTAKAKSVQPKATSKTAIVLDLLRRKEGATLAEIAKATGWENHSIRGFVSGQVTKKMGLKVESTKSEAGERTYKILS